MLKAPSNEGAFSIFVTGKKERLQLLSENASATKAIWDLLCQCLVPRLI